ncbi:splicing factor 3B subunit 1-like protein, partial [Trifolium pratense]
YIGDMRKARIAAVSPLLEHALKDRNEVHRYLAVCVVKHMTLQAVGLGVEDVLIRLLNHFWPNILENHSHLFMKVLMEAIEAMTIALGPHVIFNYCLQGLMHPARRVRNVYWLIYHSLHDGHQDALVPLYPCSVDDVSFVTFERPELQMFI